MKSLKSLLSLFAIAYVSGVPLPDSSAHAGQLTYSWAGQLVPQGAEDPWQIGSDGEPFELEISVSSNAVDLQSQPDVQFAAFEVEEVRLKLKGEEAAYIDAGVLDFTDDESNALDILSFTGNFERMGAAIEITSAVAVPHDTFQFTSLIALPPLFSPTMCADTTGSGGAGPYGSIVEAHAPLLVVPEPAALALLMTGAFMLIRRRHMRRL